MSKSLGVYNQTPSLRWVFDLHLIWCDRYHSDSGWSEKPERVLADILRFAFVEKNSLWCIINGRRLILQQGDLLILRGGDMFSWGGVSGKPNTLLGMGLRLQQEGVGNLLMKRSFARRYPLANPRQCVTHFEAIMDAIRQPMSNQGVAVTTTVFGWIQWLLDETRAPYRSKPGMNAASVQKVLDAQAWAETHLRETITLRDWAKFTGWNPTYFGSIFKQETAYRPMRWLEERRMEAASKLVLASNLSVAEIAETVGYPDSFYFSRVFKKQFKKSPLQYRKLGANQLRRESP